jgi:uncharacterized protein (TIGR01777 family)
MQQTVTLLAHAIPTQRLHAMRIVVTGATGVIGAAVTRAALARGDEVAVLTRDRDKAIQALGGRVDAHEWPEPKSQPPPAAALAGSDAVVHLLGEPIAQRWTPSTKAEIRDSRVLSTRSIVAGLSALSDSERPKAFVCQSATGYYGPRGDDPLPEDATPGDDFLAGVVRSWEHEALAASGLPGMRVATTRTGVVLSPEGGALAKMLPPFKLGVGGPVAGGRQYVPWIHLDDVVGAILHCLSDDRAHGAVNLTAPNPVTNAELSKTLGRVLHRPAVFPVPGIALRLLYGEMGTIVITGARVIPQRLGELGYSFRYPALEGALREVLGR